MVSDFPLLQLIQERFWNHIKDHESCKDYRYPTIELYVFPQMWSSTSLGFGGIGGQAFTSAYTTVITETNTNIWGVFFGERLAYVIENPNDVFMDNLKNFNMSECGMSFKYKKTNK